MKMVAKERICEQSHFCMKFFDLYPLCFCPAARQMPKSWIANSPQRSSHRSATIPIAGKTPIPKIRSGSNTKLTACSCNLEPHTEQSCLLACIIFWIAICHVGNFMNHSAHIGKTQLINFFIIGKMPQSRVSIISNDRRLSKTHPFKGQ